MMDGAPQSHVNLADPAYLGFEYVQQLGLVIEERSNGSTVTLGEEWAYVRRPSTSEAERDAEYDTFIHPYNHHRGHIALGGKSPADRVPNLCGQYT